MKHALGLAAPPSRPPRRRLAVGVGLLALALGAGASFAAVQGKGDTLTVTRKTTKLRNAKRSFAPAVADLVEGDRLVVDAAEGAWFAVTYTRAEGAAGSPVQGFVHSGDVSAKKDVRLSGEGIREEYSSSEAAAARKGFNPAVEKKYRESNPNLEAAFQLVDRIQARTVADPEIQAFLVQGGLAQGGTQ